MFLRLCMHSDIWLVSRNRNARFRVLQLHHTNLPITGRCKKKKRITHPDTLVKGINSSVTILGELNCDITIGDRNSPAFKEVNILVTSAITPILIGKNILSYRFLDQQPRRNHRIQTLTDVWSYDTHSPSNVTTGLHHHIQTQSSVLGSNYL